MKRKPATKPISQADAEAAIAAADERRCREFSEVLSKLIEKYKVDLVPAITIVGNQIQPQLSVTPRK